MSDLLARMEEAFETAVGLGPEDRREFLGRLEQSDPELRAEVVALLAADSEAGGFLDRPVTELAQLSPASREASLAEDRTGQVLGGYTITRLIGTGGMSFVYEGEKQGDGFLLTAAIKVIRADGDAGDLAWRFVRERRLLASLRHPNIARLLDGGTTPDGRPYLIMEYVDGLPIDRYCREHCLSVPQRLRLFRDVCDAVASAHRALVVHRDLKPSNILVTTDGMPKLLDFGIAKLLSDADEDRDAGPSPTDRDPLTYGCAGSETTLAGTRLLTPRYASPEQIRGEPTTTATDVYALGILLYELLTGGSPYADEDVNVSIENSIVSQPPTRPSQAVQTSESEEKYRTEFSGAGNWARQLEGDLDHIILRTLAKVPERRYSSVELLATDIDRHLRSLPVRAHPDSPRYRLSKFVRRNPTLVGLIVLLVLVLGAFTATTMVQLQRTAAERDRANREAALAGQTAAFLEDLFRVSDPSESRGETITVRQILDRGAITAREKLGDQPTLKARFLRTLGSVHASLGLYDRADSLLAESVQLYRDHGVGEDAELASALDQHAHVAKQKGRVHDAKSLAVEALTLREAHVGPDALSTAQSLNNVALLELSLNNLDAAGLLFERAARIREKELGPNHPDVAGTLHNIGNLYCAQGRYEEAGVAYQRALDARLASGSEVHPGAAGAYSGLASVAMEQGRYADAEAFQLRSLRIKEELFGEVHISVASAYANLALVRMKIGNLEAARNAAVHSVGIFRQTVDSSHPYFGSALLALGKIEIEMGDLDSALGHAEQAHRIFLAAVPSGHPDLVDATATLANILRRTGRNGEAEALEGGRR